MKITKPFTFLHKYSVKITVEKANLGLRDYFLFTKLRDVHNGVKMTRICLKVFKNLKLWKALYIIRLQVQAGNHLLDAWRKTFPGKRIQQGQQFRRIGPLLRYTGPYVFTKRNIPFYAESFSRYKIILIWSMKAQLAGRTYL